MSDGHKQMARYLAYAGVLPPWLALALHIAVALPSAGYASVTYGATIVSFVCGMHWGIYLQPRLPIRVNLLVTSNVVALFAWVMAMASLSSVGIACLGLAIALGVLLIVDRLLLSAGVIEAWFWTLRRNASMCLAAGLVLWSILA